jgi:hypothetical protein
MRYIPRARHNLTFSNEDGILKHIACLMEAGSTKQKIAVLAKTISILQTYKDSTFEGSRAAAR